MDPLYCECRTYGRIGDALVNGTLKDNPALPCYGYMILRPEAEEFLHQNGVKLSGENSDADSHSSSETPHATCSLSLSEHHMVWHFRRSPSLMAWRSGWQSFSRRQ